MPEDIREGLKVELQKMVFVGDELTLDYDELVDRLLTYLKENGVAKIKEGIFQADGTAASPEAWWAIGVGMSWERNAHMFRAFKEAGYTLTEEIT